VTLSSVDAEKVKTLANEIAGLKNEIMGVLQEEAQEKELRGTEMQITKGQNLLDHKDEIYAKPKRTWFQTGKDKASAREKGAQEWSDKMGNSTNGGGGGRRDRKAPQPILNHKQRRRKEALDEIKTFKKGEGNQGPGTMGAVKAVKKAARPTAIRQFRGDDAPSAGSGGKKSKSKGKKTKGGFGEGKKSKSSFNRKGGK